MKLFNKIAYHSTHTMGLKEFNDVTDTRYAFKGEGAMVHGWGLYLQEDKKLNEDYYLSRFVKYEDDLDLGEWKKFEEYPVIFELSFGGKRWIGLNTEYNVNRDFLDIINFNEVYWYSNFDDDVDNLMYEEYEPEGQALSILLECRGNKQYALDAFDKNIKVLQERDEDIAYDQGFDNDDDWNKAIKWCEDIKKAIENIPDDFTSRVIRFDEWKDAVPQGQKKTQGAQYTVEIPDDWIFIDEDKTISQILNDNNTTVFEKLSKSLWKIADRTKATYDEWRNRFFNIDGRNLYLTIFKGLLGSEQKASWYLSEHGVNGIEYDGGRDGHCYVIFDCEGLKIIKEE